MGSFGERLKRTRENRKITLDQVATATKISARMLKALEDEKFDQLPGGIFNKGFVRSYARFLGIDEGQAVADYLQASGESNQPPAPEDAELKAIAERKDKERERQRAHAGGMPWGLTAAVLLLIALALSVWGFYSREKQDSRRAAMRKPTVASATSEAAAPVPPPQATLTDVSDSSSTGQSNMPAAGSVADSAAPSAGSFTVFIQANEDSWLTVTADGKQVFSDTLVAQATKTFQAQKQLVVRAGNAGGLDISFNGQKLSSTGEAGEVKTLTFGPSGIEPSSPKPIE